MVTKRKFIYLTSGVLAYLTANFSSAAFIFKPKKEVKGIPK
jgi:hypothetical protein